MFQDLKFGSELAKRFVLVKLDTDTVEGAKMFKKFAGPHGNAMPLILIFKEDFSKPVHGFGAADKQTVEKFREAIEGY